MPPTLAIVCGTNHLRRVECDRFVASVIRATSDVDWTLYLGDVSPPEYPLYRHPHPRVRVVREWPRAGVSAGYNTLASLGNEEWITWANDDAEYWIEPLESRHEASREVSSWALAAIRALEAEPRASAAVGYYQTPHPPDGWHVNEFPAGLLYPNFGLFRRRAFEACGGFDPRVKMYGMDNALCFRLLNGSPDPNKPGDGGAMLAVPEFKIIHHYAEDPSRAANMQRTSALNAAWDEVLREWLPHVPRLQRVQDAIPRAPLVLDDPRTYESLYGRRLDTTPSEQSVVR